LESRRGEDGRRERIRYESESHSSSQSVIFEKKADRVNIEISQMYQSLNSGGGAGGPGLPAMMGGFSDDYDIGSIGGFGGGGGGGRGGGDSTWADDGGDSDILDDDDE